MRTKLMRCCLMFGLVTLIGLCAAAGAQDPPFVENFIQAPPATAQDPPADDDAPKKPTEEKITVVLEGLHNPTGLAKQPGTGHIFVADSGTAKVVRIVDG